MNKFIAVMVLLTAFGIPLAAQTASAASVSPSSSSFGGMDTDNRSGERSE